LDAIDGKTISLLSKYGDQQRSQAPTEALQDVIKSALFYRSTRVSRPTEPSPTPPPVDPEDSSHIDATELDYTGQVWHFNRTLIGLHDRGDRHPQPADHAIARGQFDSIKVQSGVTVPGMKGYNARFYLCRPFQSWNGRHIPAQDFVNAVAADIAPLAAAGVEYFEFQNEPNLTHEGLSAHGVVGSWRDGSEFARYFIEGRKLLRQRFPGINVGFPGLSPGPDAPYQFGHDRGFRTNHREFLDGAVVTIREAKEFYRLVGQIPGIAAAYYFVVSGAG
jgi:hypothetical protein